MFLISKLALEKNNARELIAEGILPILIDLTLLAHLHTNRAKIHTQVRTQPLTHATIKAMILQVNAIETNGSSADRESKEWYYNDKAGQRQGPLSFQEASNQSIKHIPISTYFNCR